MSEHCSKIQTQTCQVSKHHAINKCNLQNYVCHIFLLSSCLSMDSLKKRSEKRCTQMQLNICRVSICTLFSCWIRAVDKADFVGFQAHIQIASPIVSYNCSAVTGCYLHRCCSMADWRSEVSDGWSAVDYWTTTALDSHQCRVSQTCRKCRRTDAAPPCVSAPHSSH